GRVDQDDPGAELQLETDAPALVPGIVGPADGAGAADHGLSAGGAAAENGDREGHGQPESTAATPPRGCGSRRRAGAPRRPRPATPAARESGPGGERRAPRPAGARRSGGWLAREAPPGA